MGENKNIDNRTSVDEQCGIQSKNAVVDKLIDRFLTLILTVGSAMKQQVWCSQIQKILISTLLTSSINFILIDFPDTQAEEIRNIITVTMEKRGYVPEPVTAEEPVIVHNEVVETAKLPPLLDENIINDIMKLDRFFKVKRDEIADFFKENEDYDKRCEFMKFCFSYGKIYAVQSK